MNAAAAAPGWPRRRSQVSRTASRSRRAGVLAVELPATMGQALKTSEEYQEILKESALLHDIGKIGIPENILNKTGKF